MTNSRKHISLDEEVHEELDELKESQSLPSLSSAVRFLFEERSMNMYLSRFDRDTSDTIQPLERTTIPKSIVFCPICGNAVAQLQFTEDENPEMGLPSFLYGGNFYCRTEDCRANDIPGEIRQSHHLIAVPFEDDKPSSEEMETALVSHWNSILPARDMDESERESRIKSWTGLSKACEWEWRPPLSLWREFVDLEAIMQSAEALLQDCTAVEASAVSPTADCCSDADWHFHVELSDTKSDNSVSETEQLRPLYDAVTLVETWLSDSSVEVETIDTDDGHSILLHGV